MIIITMHALVYKESYKEIIADLPQYWGEITQAWSAMGGFCQPSGEVAWGQVGVLTATDIWEMYRNDFIKGR